MVNFLSKLRVSVGITRRIEFVMNWDETTVYVLGFYVGYVAAQSFWAWLFGSQIGCLEMECAAFSVYKCRLQTGVKCRLGYLDEICKHFWFLSKWLRLYMVLICFNLGKTPPFFQWIKKHVTAKLNFLSIPRQPIQQEGQHRLSWPW